MQTATVDARRSLAQVIAVLVVVALLPIALARPAQAARVKTIKIADASIVEGNAGLQNLSFSISWTGSKGGPAPSVQWATADASSATAGDDYTASSGTATLTNGGCKCKVVTVPIKGDTITEGTETFVVNLSNPVNGVIGDTQATGTIYDNEGDPALVVGDTSAAEAGGTITFTVQLTNASASTVTVAYATADGTAVAGTDYTAASNTLTFTAGQTSKSVPVSVSDETLSEDDETIALDLSSPTNATIADAQGVGSIVNDDADPTVSIADTSAGEADGTMTFTVSLDAASGRETAVDYATADASALAGSDYTETTGTLTIPAGSTSATFDVPLSADTTYEGGSETFTATLSGEVDLTLGTSTATGTINDDDAAPTLGVASSTASEGAATATVTFSLTNATNVDVTFDWSTSDGTATDGADYTASAGSGLTIAAGATSTTATVPLLADTADEPAETFTVTLANVANATDGGPGTITISDDDPSITTLTAKAFKTKKAVLAKGLLEPATSTCKVRVMLQRKKGAKWVKVAIKSVTVKGLLDRDADGKADAQYTASFPKPKRRGVYRFKVDFLGTPGLLKSTKVVGFRV